METLAYIILYLAMGAWIGGLFFVIHRDKKALKKYKDDYDVILDLYETAKHELNKLQFKYGQQSQELLSLRRKRDNKGRYLPKNKKQ